MTKPQFAAPLMSDGHSCALCPIRERAVCSYCEPDEIDVLETAKFYRSFEAGQTILWAGDRMDFVASVVVGVASLTQTLEDGRTQIVGMLLPSDFLGRPGRERASYTVTAMTDVTLCCFRRRPFETLLIQTPHLARRLLEITLDELDAAREWMLLLGRKTAREKIASLFVMLARRCYDVKLEHANGPLPKAGNADAKVSAEIDLPLTREAMADYLGLTLETVSRQITALRRDRLIEMTGIRDVHIPDVRLLAREAGLDPDGPLSGR